MKLRLLSVCLLFPAALPAATLPFRSGTITGGFSAAAGWGSYARGQVCANLVGSDRNQWYFGGTTIKSWPGGGTYTLPAITLTSNPAATATPFSHALSDVDRDGDLDIVRAVDWGNKIHGIAVYLNQGGGTFTVGWRRDWTEDPAFDEGGHNIHIVAGDFDRNGGPDIAILTVFDFLNPAITSYPERGTLHIRWNDGSGGFSDITTVEAAGFSDAATLTPGDIDMDGDTDLVATAWDYRDGGGVWRQNVRYLTNDGTGAFTPSLAQKARWHVSLEDMNRDSWPDEVSVTPAGNVCALNALDGTFPTDSPVVDTSHSHYSLGDLDGDGIVDLACTDSSSPTTLVWKKGVGNGTFAVGTILATLASNINGIAVADSEPDGDMDIMVQGENGAFTFIENLSIHLSFQPTTTQADAAASLAGVTQLAAADFDRDGHVDVLALTPSQEKIWYFKGEADGVPSAAPSFKYTQNEAAARMTVADFNRDGRPDVAYSLPAVGQVRIAHNTVDDAPVLWPDSATAAFTGVTLLTTGEMNLPDGRPELLACSSSGQVRWIYPAGAVWLTQPVGSAFSPVPDCLAAVDSVTRPGDEVFVKSSSASTLRIPGMQLNPSWTLGQSYTEAVTAPVPAVMAWGDFEPGGRMEAALVNGQGKLIYWKPAANSTTSTLIGTPEGIVRDLAAADFTQDGRTDLLCATSTGLYLFYKPAASWLQRRIIAYNQGYNCLAVADLNHDGLMDFAAGSTAGGRVHFFTNRGSFMDVVYQESAAVMVPGSTASVLAATAQHPGKSTAWALSGNADPAVAVKRALVRFSRANLVNGVYQQGNPLTEAEFDSIIYSASLRINNALFGSSGAAGFEPVGANLPIEFNAALGTYTYIPGGGSVPLDLRLTLTTDAASSSIKAFYISWNGITAEAQDGSARTSGANTTGDFDSLVIITPAYTSLQQWRHTHFGTYAGFGEAANNADPDNDGVPNLAEYFTGTNPNASEAALNSYYGLTLLPPPTRQTPVNLRVFGTTTALADPKLRVFIQSSTGSLDSWSTLSWRAGGGTWTGVVPTVLPPVNGISNVFFTTAITQATTPKFFVRLRLEELP